jgi:hypothetical protein
LEQLLSLLVSVRQGIGAGGPPTPVALSPNRDSIALARSIKEECLDRMIPLGQRHFRRAVIEFIAHYHRERNQQGLRNALIEGALTTSSGRVHRQHRLGGLLSYYKRVA